MAKKADPSRSSNNKVVATNRKARHNYSILETFEAGVALVGTEVKSLRDGQASLADAFATVDDGEIWLRNLHIPEYHHGSWTNHAPRRNRKLLLHRKQIDTLVGKIRDGNLTLVPLSLYFSDGKVKVELALARGKQAHDKRQDMARRDAQREVTRELGRRAKGMILTGGRLSRCRRRLGYGISDFVGGIASRRVAALRVVLVSYPVALVLLTVLAVIVGGHITGAAIFWGALCGVSQAFGVWWFYAALGVGPDLGGVAADGDPGRRRSRSVSAWRWGSGRASIAGDRRGAGVGRGGPGQRGKPPMRTSLRTSSRRRSPG